MGRVSGVAGMKATITVNGNTYDSVREYQLSKTLHKLSVEGRIREFEVHPEYPLIVEGITLGVFKPSFRFIDGVSGDEKFVVVTHQPNRLKELKVRLFEALYGVTVEGWA
jgi:hypothetical protein